MVKAEYYILIGGNETGPWTLGQVQAFWRAGAVTLETLYAQPGADEWKPLSAILDVAPSAVATPTPQSENSYADEQRKMIETVVNVMLPVETVGDRMTIEYNSNMELNRRTDADCPVDIPADDCRKFVGNGCFSGT